MYYNFSFPTCMLPLYIKEFEHPTLILCLQVVSSSSFIYNEGKHSLVTHSLPNFYVETYGTQAK